MSCLLCKSGCAHCRAERLWVEVQAIAAAVGDTATNGAEAYGLIDTIAWDAFYAMEILDEDGERDSQAYRAELRTYQEYAGLRERLDTAVAEGVIQWR